MLFGKGEDYKLGIYLVLEHIWACSALKSTKNDPKIREITFQPKKIIRNCTFSILINSVGNIGHTHKPFFYSESGKKNQIMSNT